MLEINELVRRHGEKEILSGLSLAVEKKGIYGILGAKDVQRHALARIICGCEDADGGAVVLDGTAMSRDAVALKRRVRLVPSVLLVDPSQTAAEYLDFVGDAMRIESEKRYRQIKEALELVGIDAVQNRLIASLGVGDRCRLSVAASLIGNPEIIVFDDPFASLDDSTRTDMYGLLGMLAKIKTVILLSHTPSEVKLLCSQIAIIGGGKIALEGEISEIEAKINATHELYISVRGDGESVISAIKGVDTVVGAKINTTEKNGVHSVRVEHYPDGNIKDKLFAALSAVNAPMLSVRALTLTLDDVYYSLTASEKETDESDDIPVKKKRLGRRSGK